MTAFFIGGDDLVTYPARIPVVLALVIWAFFSVTAAEVRIEPAFSLHRRFVRWQAVPLPDIHDARLCLWPVYEIRQIEGPGLLAGCSAVDVIVNLLVRQSAGFQDIDPSHLSEEGVRFTTPRFTKIQLVGRGGRRSPNGFSWNLFNFPFRES